MILYGSMIHWQVQLQTSMEALLRVASDIRRLGYFESVRTKHLPVKKLETKT